MESFKVTKSEVGAHWPFTVDEVTVELGNTDTKPVYLIANGVRYNYNGSARGGEDLSIITSEYPGIPGSRKQTGFIFQMCDDRGWNLGR